MNDVNRQIRDRIEAFVSELNDLVRQAALDAVSDALNSGSVSVGGRRGGAGVVGLPRAARFRRGGGKRSPAEIEATTQQVLTYVQQNPGNGVEQMARDLDTSTRDLTLPIKKLISSGQIATKGHKRATKYFAGSGGAAAGGGRRRKAAAKPARASKRRGRARKSKRG